MLKHLIDALHHFSPVTGRSSRITAVSRTPIPTPGTSAVVLADGGKIARAGAFCVVYAGMPHPHSIVTDVADSTFLCRRHGETPFASTLPFR